MTPREYIEAAQRTKSDRSPRMTGNLTADILHAILGICTEGGELLDAVKKSLFYGKDLDLINIDEEMGDVLWYIAIYCAAANTTFEDLMEKNIKKLKQRYPEKFSDEAALFRDLDAERKALETKG